jgi:3-oxoacyl-[acyl-carrier protein] reductase
VRKRNWKKLLLWPSKEGVNVILVARTQEELDNVAAKARSLRVKALAVTADVADINSVNAAVETALAEFGTIDILINNAGAAFGKFLELEPAMGSVSSRVNLMGTYYMTRAVLPNMIERQIGDIINISSTAGLSGNALTSAIALQICRYGIDRIIDAGSPQTQHSCDGISTVAQKWPKI